MCVAKRKADSSLDCPPAKLARSAEPVRQEVTDSDLIVLGIPYTFSTADLQAFFSQFGPLKVCQVRGGMCLLLENIMSNLESEYCVSLPY